MCDKNQPSTTKKAWQISLIILILQSERRLKGEERIILRRSIFLSSWEIEFGDEVKERKNFSVNVSEGIYDISDDYNLIYIDLEMV